MEHDASTLCLKPILSRAAISLLPYVRPIALISFSTDSLLAMKKRRLRLRRVVLLD